MNKIQTPISVITEKAGPIGIQTNLYPLVNVVRLCTMRELQGCGKFRKQELSPPSVTETEISMVYMFYTIAQIYH